MPAFWCTQCHQFFSGGGYCPYDGSPLSVRAGQGESTISEDAAPGRFAPRDALTQPGADSDGAYAHLIGQTLDGRYRIDRKIGEGGMGVVFAARHLVIERPLAIKVLRREVASDPDTTKRFVQEAKAASRIGHPHIVDVTDFGTTPDGMTYQVMEYINGETLSHALKQSSPLPLSRSLPIAAQIAQALGAAHAKGIVHRDLKPENIFLVTNDDRCDFVKIVDFGIAKVAPLPNAPNQGPRLTRAGSVFGTPEYMAPEQAAGRSDTDGRVDIYALGTILYEMITGRVPHRSESTVRTLAMQMLDPIEPPSQFRPDLDIAPEVEAVVMHALAKNREQRYQTMAEFYEAIRSVANAREINLAQPVSASIAGPTTPTQPAAGPHERAEQPTLPDNRQAPPPTAQLPPPLPPITSAEYLHHLPTRPVNEPAFVTGAPKVTFEVVDEDPLPPHRPRYLVAIIAIALFGGAGVGAAFLLKRASSSDVQNPDAMVAKPPLPVDGRATENLPDATPIALGRTDASVDGLWPTRPTRPPLARAAAATTLLPVDAGMHTSPAQRGNVSIEVLTRPIGGILYINRSYRGPGGTHLEEPKGSRATVTCTLPGYEKGTVELIFDGSTEIALCRMERINPCVPGLKNPFDDCPE